MARRSKAYIGRAARLGGTGLDLARQYPGSWVNGYRDRDLWQGVETFCLFLGFPRSGHSLVGALLDAHPNVVIAHELDVLQYVYARYGKRQIYALLLERARRYSAEERMRGGRVYQVPGPWTGSFEKLQVIGDKHGEATTLRLQANPELLPRLRRLVDTDIRVIQVIRNPYDNIATISKRTKRQGQSLDLPGSIDYYFSLCKTVSAVQAQLEEQELFALGLESFIDNPRLRLAELCHFLGVDAPDRYLDDCASIVFKSPNITRHEVSWNRGWIDAVAEGIQQTTFLKGYAYEF
jgi:hypothetical protein